MRTPETLESLKQRHAWIIQVYSTGIIDAYLFTQLVANHLAQAEKFLTHSPLSADEIIPLLLKLKEFLLEIAGEQAPLTRECHQLFAEEKRLEGSTTDSESTHLDSNTSFITLTATN